MSDPGLPDMPHTTDDQPPGGDPGSVPDDPEPDTED
jgi:hypothetical protein